jgi:hypothetical protein
MYDSTLNLQHNFQLPTSNNNNNNFQQQQQQQLPNPNFQQQQQGRKVCMEWAKQSYLLPPWGLTLDDASEQVVSHHAIL